MRKICGEIFELKNEKFEISCLECNKKFRKFNEFIKHRKINCIPIKALREDQVKQEDLRFIALEHSYTDLTKKKCIKQSFQSKFMYDKSLQTAQVQNEDMCDSITTTFQSESEDGKFNVPVPSETLLESSNISNIILLDKANSSQSFNKDAESYVKSDKKKRLGNFVSCIKCLKSFNSYIKLMDHQLTEHRIIQINCHCCELQFSSKSEFLRNHEKPLFENLKCLKCGRLSKTGKHLKNHICRDYHKGNYVCEFCAKTFQYEYYLSQHLISHSDMRPYKCDKCDLGFKTQKVLEAHKMVHSEIRAYQCDNCLKQFKNKRSLHKHLRNIHSGREMKHKCEICDKQFFEVTDRKKHQERIHGLSFVYKKVQKPISKERLRQLEE